MPIDTRTCPKCQRTVMGKMNLAVGSGEAPTGGPFLGIQLQMFRCECGCEWSEPITPPKPED